MYLISTGHSPCRKGTLTDQLFVDRTTSIHIREISGWPRLLGSLCKLVNNNKKNKKKEQKRQVSSTVIFAAD